MISINQPIKLLQATGQSTKDAMSQKAVTVEVEKISALDDRIDMLESNAYDIFSVDYWQEEEPAPTEEAIWYDTFNSMYVWLTSENNWMEIPLSLSKIYIDRNTNFVYTWSGGIMVQVSSQINKFIIESLLTGEINTHTHPNIYPELETVNKWVPSAINEVKTKADMAISGYLGSITYNAVAPTPGVSGYYMFSTGGACTWIAGSPVVKIGDIVSMKYTLPSTYVYTHIVSNLGNKTVIIPINSRISANTPWDMVTGKIGYSVDRSGSQLIAVPYGTITMYNENNQLLQPYAFNFYSDKGLFISSVSGSNGVIMPIGTRFVTIRTINDVGHPTYSLDIVKKCYFSIVCSFEENQLYKDFISKYKKSPAYGVCRFSTQVNRVNPNTSISNTTIPDQPVYDTDYCVALMPDPGTYEFGKLPKVILFNHGSGQQVYENTATITTQNGDDLAQYFASQGYVVLMCNGLPLQYATDNGILGSYGRPVGNWMCTESYAKAWKYMCDNFEIDTNNCYLFGDSQGAMTAENLLANTNIPIHSVALTSPCLSMKLNQIYISGAISVMNLLYQTTSVFQNQTSLDEVLVEGNDPWKRNIVNGDNPVFTNTTAIPTLIGSISDVASKRYHKCPIKIFTSTNDSVISADVAKVYVKQMKNLGIQAEINLYVNAGHSYSGIISILAATGTFNFMGSNRNVYSLYSDILAFLERY